MRGRGHAGFSDLTYRGVSSGPRLRPTFPPFPTRYATTPFHPRRGCCGAERPGIAQNDECATASTLSLGSISYDTTTATQSPEVWPCAGTGGPDLWYVFTAPNAANYTFDTCGSSYDTAIEMFDGTCALQLRIQR